MALRILIVEDDADQARSLMTLLQGCGHDARVAHDGRAALELAAAAMPQVVLLDLRLPGLDGHEVAKRMRGLNHPTRPVLIAITGYDEEFDRLRPSEEGVDLCLRKPTDPEALVRLLDRLAGGLL